MEKWVGGRALVFCGMLIGLLYPVIARSGSDEAICSNGIGDKRDCFTSFAMTRRLIFNNLLMASDS
jgi:hypothetical protein